MDNLRFSSAPTADSIDASIVQHYPDCEPVAVIGYAPAIFLNRRMAKRSGKICWKVVNAADALRAKSFWPSVWMPPSLTILIMSISVRC